MLLLAIAFLSSSLQDPPALRSGIGNYKLPVAFRVPLAKNYFDQALALQYAFHKKEANACFQEAARLEPDSALSWWGVALSLGPDINVPSVSAADSVAAIEALKKAAATAKTKYEKELVAAAFVRFDEKGPANRAALDKSYSVAMSDLARSFPKDPDILCLYAESLMILRPWDQWKPNGEANPGTQEAIDALQKALKLSPKHLLANHLWVHIWEASKHPEKAIPAADFLCTATPALGHLVHMPSHTYVRVGNWAKAIRQNELALDSDSGFFKTQQPHPNYLPYIAHNHMMLAYAATMNGQYGKAKDTLQQLRFMVPKDMLKDFAPMLDGSYGMILDVERRFGKWDNILAEPAYPDYFPIANAMRLANRAIALAAKGDTEAANKEFAGFLLAKRQVSKDGFVGLNSASSILSIEQHLAKGEILVQEGDIDASVAELKEAVKAEDQLRYDEPPDWIQPTRHTLGAVLVRAKRYNDAVEVYQEDLKILPNNGWSLQGLYQCYKALGKTKLARKYDRMFKKVWAKDAEPIATSCLCLPPKK